MCLNDKWLVEQEDWEKPGGWAEGASKGRLAAWTVVKVSRVWLSSLAGPGDKVLVLEVITGLDVVSVCWPSRKRSQVTARKRCGQI